MHDNKILQTLYTVFVGILIALFIGVGVSTFYPGPESPDYPSEYSTRIEEPVMEQDDQAQRYDREYAAYQEKAEVYNRNVSMIALVAAVICIALGIFMEKRIKVIANGIMLGGIFTLLYSIGRAFATDDNRYVFILLTVSLIIVFYLGYRRFVREESKPKSKK